MRTRDAVMLLLVLAGCLPGKTYQGPKVELPASYRERLDRAPDPAPPAALPVPRGAGGATSDFWQAIRDTTLDRLLTLAVQDNLDVRVAETRIRQARAARRSAAADRTPLVSAGAGYTRQRLAGATFPGSSGRFPDQSVWDVGFDAGWEIDLFGRIRHGVGAEGAFLEAAGHDLRDVQVTLVAEVARSYFELRGAQSQLAVALRNAENQRRTLGLVTDRLTTGLGSAFDTERAQAQLSATLSTVPGLEANVAAAQYRLGVLAGRSPAEVVPGLAAVGQVPVPPADLDLGLPDTLVRRRSDVAAAERRVAGAAGLVEANRAALLPRVSLGGSIGLAAGGAGSLGERGTFRYAVGPVVSVPVFGVGRLKASVDASRAREEEARLQYHQVVLRALEDVEVSLVRYRSSVAQVDRVEEAAAASGRAAELARTRFVEGLADFLQVLDAERTQLEAESRLEAARVEAATAFASLYKALGGDLPGGSGR